MRYNEDVERDDNMNKIVTALIGYGFSGSTFHLPPLVHNPNYKIKYVMTRNEIRQNEAKKDCKGVMIATTYEEILKDKEVDLIIIATSNSVHYQYTKEALLHGKHVVCEKPFVESYNLAKELYDLAEQKGLVLRVFHNRKYDGDFLTVQNLLKEKNFGDIISFSTRFDQFKPEIGENWRFKKVDMAGNFYDLAPHLVHHVVALFGKPNKVYNKIYHDRPGILVDDHFEMILYYDQLTCYIGAEMLDRDPKPRMFVVGTNATYTKYEFDYPDTVDVKQEDVYQKRQMRSEFIDNSMHIEKIKVLKGKHYYFYELLAAHITNKPKVDEDKDLALLVILVMEMAMKSALTNKEVEIPFKK